MPATFAPFRREAAGEQASARAEIEDTLARRADVEGAQARIEAVRRAGSVAVVVSGRAAPVEAAARVDAIERLIRHGAALS